MEIKSFVAQYALGAFNLKEPQSCTVSHTPQWEEWGQLTQALGTGSENTLCVRSKEAECATRKSRDKERQTPGRNIILDCKSRAKGEQSCVNNQRVYKTSPLLFVYSTLGKLHSLNQSYPPPPLCPFLPMGLSRVQNIAATVSGVSKPNLFQHNSRVPHVKL